MKNIINGWTKKELVLVAQNVHDYKPQITLLQAKRALLTVNKRDFKRNLYNMHDIIRIARTK